MYISIGLLEYYEIHMKHGYWNDMYNKIDFIATQKFLLFFLKDSFWSKTKEEQAKISKQQDTMKGLGAGKKTPGAGLFSKPKKN
jgi:hypothetical protein